MIEKPLRKCNDCGIEAWEAEDLEVMVKDKRQKHGRANCCKSCGVKRTQKCNHTQPKEYFQNRHLVKTYGITLQAKEDMYNGDCPICLRDRAFEDMVIDHNHKTGEIRGLICTNCNTSLGGFGDNPDTLLRARDYLIQRGDYRNG